MTEVIVLDPPEAEKVRGRSPKTGRCVLDPVPLKDGRFFLGAEVLDDPAHADVRDYLRSMPLVALEKLPRFTEEDETPAEFQIDLANRVNYTRDFAGTKDVRTAEGTEEAGGVSRR